MLYNSTYVFVISVPISILIVKVTVHNISIQVLKKCFDFLAIVKIVSSIIFTKNVIN